MIIFSDTRCSPVVTATLSYLETKVNTTESMWKSALTVRGSGCLALTFQTSEEDHEKEVTGIL